MRAAYEGGVEVGQVAYTKGSLVSCDGSPFVSRTRGRQFQKTPGVKVHE